MKKLILSIILFFTFLSMSYAHSPVFGDLEVFGSGSFLEGIEVGGTTECITYKDSGETICVDPDGVVTIQAAGGLNSDYNVIYTLDTTSERGIQDT